MDKNMLFILDSFLRAEERFVPRNAFDLFGVDEGKRIYTRLLKENCIDSSTKDGVELRLERLKEFRDSFS